MPLKLVQEDMSPEEQQLLNRMVQHDHNQVQFSRSFQQENAGSYQQQQYQQQYHPAQAAPPQYSRSFPQENAGSYQQQQYQPQPQQHHYQSPPQQQQPQQTMNIAAYQQQYLQQQREEQMRREYEASQQALQQAYDNHPNQYFSSFGGRPVQDVSQYLQRSKPKTKQPASGIHSYAAASNAYSSYFD